jgi:RimJ/RimL family protein N-acetyltransferase
MLSPDVLEKRYAEDSMSVEDRETLLVVDKGNKIIGTVNYSKSIPYFNTLELGYHIFSIEHRGKGIASEAIGLLTGYLFNSRLINRLEIRLDVENRASERVAIKCNFKKEGISRGANFVNGRFIDMAVYALLRSEWESLGQTT